MSAQGRVRACASDSYNRWCDEAAATVRAHIKAEGYKPKELATRLPSVQARGLFQQRWAAHLIMEEKRAIAALSKVRQPRLDGI